MYNYNRLLAAAVPGGISVYHMVEQTKTIVELVTAGLALPAAVVAVVLLLRYLKSRLREQPPAQVQLENERAYMWAVENYMKDLNNQGNFYSDEYTPLPSEFVGEAAVELRLRFRRATKEDQRGLSVADIRSTAKRTHAKNVFSYLNKATQPLVLLGEPGSGKSVTMRRLAMNMARRELRRKPVWPKLPIYLQLGAYTQTRQGDGGKPEPIPVIEFVKYQLREIIPGGEAIVDSLDSILRQSRAILLFDSMDEMPAADYQQRTERLKEFMIAYGGRNALVVACRNREYTGEFAHSELLIQPFDDRRIREYLTKQWARCHDELADDENKATTRARFLDVANPDHPQHDMATNPFSLKLLARFFFDKKGAWPKVQAEVYRNYLEEKLHSEARSGRSKGRMPAPDRLLEVWSAVAYAMLKEDLGTFVTIEQLQGSQSLIDTGRSLISEAVKVAVNCAIMREENDGTVRFEHHRLLEYLAATHWEADSQSLILFETHIKNPWWRETLSLRAGITKDPNRLINQLFGLTNRRYLATIGVTITHPGQDNTDPPSETGPSGDIDRLEFLSTIEIALGCARQRFKDLGAKTIGDLQFITERLALHGTLLEKVRLARALKGFPLSFTKPMMQPMVQSGSDWLVEEAFHSLDPSEADSPEYAELVAALCHSTPRNERLLRMLKVGHVPLRALLGKNAARIRGTLVLSLFSLISVTSLYILALFVVYRLHIFDPNAIAVDTKSHIPWRIISVVGFMCGLVFLTAGRDLALALFAICLVLPFLLPIRSAVRYEIACATYGVFVGQEFRRARWIRNRFRRAITLYPVLPVLFRYVVLGEFLFATSVLVCNRAGGAAVSGHLLFALSMGAAVVGDILFMAWQRRSISKFLAKGSGYVDERKVEEFLNECLDQLRRPRALVINRKILSRIAELRFDGQQAIQGLKRLADSGEFFLPRDELLLEIDRMDQRRKQRLLDPPWVAPPSKPAPLN